MPERTAAPGPAWARWRSPIGYPTAALCLWLAHPTFRSILIGSSVAVLGLLIRAVAAGYLRKREAARRIGTRIAIVGDPKQHSTRELLARLRTLSHV